MRVVKAVADIEFGVQEEIQLMSKFFTTRILYDHAYRSHCSRESPRETKVRVKGS